MDKQCTLSNEELVERCNEWVSKLAKSGGKDWCLRVPVNFNTDPDMLFVELVNRFKATYQSNSGVQNLELIAAEIVDNIWIGLPPDDKLVISLQQKVLDSLKKSTLTTPNSGGETGVQGDSRTAKQVLEKYFYKPEVTDWYTTVLEAMEEYRLATPSNNQGVLPTNPDNK